VGLGWREAYSGGDGPGYVNLDVCYRLAVGPSDGDGRPWAVWAYLNMTDGVQLAGSHGTQEQAAVFLRSIVGPTQARPATVPAAAQQTAPPIVVHPPTMTPPPPLPQVQGPQGGNDNGLHEVLGEMPPAERQYVDLNRVGWTASTLPDDILMVAHAMITPAVAGPAPQVRVGTVLVTSTQLMFLDSTGGTLALGYLNIEKIKTDGGTQKFFGGHDKAKMRIHIRGGIVEEWTVGVTPEWGLRTAVTAQMAYEDYLKSVAGYPGQ
jgi:hypothetical protein